MPETVLLSQYPLPYHKLGSWTTLYMNYLNTDHQIDHIICEKPIKSPLFKNVNYVTFRKSFKFKVIQKITKNTQYQYIKKLKKLIKPGNKYVIQIVDNFKIVPQIEELITAYYQRSDFYIQFFYHSYPPFLSKEKGISFFKFVNEIVLLTKSSATIHEDYYKIKPHNFSILYNGIDSRKFFSISEKEKIIRKNEMGYSGKKIFLWVSQDKPKKGLDLLLKVWKTISEKYPDILLLVAGSTRVIESNSIQILGKVPNDMMPQYYQMADYYVFPTLCEEGFPMSLSEAVKCGCHCIASSIGGVPEVLNYGTYGKLVTEPFSEMAWTEAIEEALKYKKNPYLIPEDIYSINQWVDGMNTLINNAKIKLQRSS
ncbi:glycosyltransferase [Flavobacteriaceae bacterium R38]|nr:glycosyltransferase [Flavobacteriaceae bacterium R38]